MRRNQGTSGYRCVMHGGMDHPDYKSHASPENLPLVDPASGPQLVVDGQHFARALKAAFPDVDYSYESWPPVTNGISYAFRKAYGEDGTVISISTTDARRTFFLTKALELTNAWLKTNKNNSADSRIIHRGIVQELSFVRAGAPKID